MTIPISTIAKQARSASRKNRKEELEAEAAAKQADSPSFKEQASELSEALRTVAEEEPAIPIPTEEEVAATLSDDMLLEGSSLEELREHGCLVDPA